MNRPLFALLCAATALAGWGGMAWWRGAHGASPGKTAIHSPAGGATAPGDFARPAGKQPPGANPGLSPIADALALARALNPDDAEALAKLSALPPGTARDLAQALVAARRAAREGAESPSFNPFADLPADALPVAAWPDTMRGQLLAGKPLREFAEAGDQSTEPLADPFGSSGEPEFDIGDITLWAALDPAAASETILKMPPGQSRTAAVDAAAKVMARDNPQAAWDLVLKSGEQKLGEGAALAWLAKIGQHAETNKQLAAGLSPAQQENMAKALGDLMDSKAGGVSDKEVSLLAFGVPSLTRGPAQEKLLAAIAERNPIFLYWATGGAKYFRPDEPAHVLVAAQMMIEGAQTDPLDVLAQITGGVPNSARTTLSSTAGFPSQHVASGAPDSPFFPPVSAPHYQPQYEPVSPAVLNAAAPRLLPQLANAGHVTEAAQLLPRITAPEAQRAALESILPQWMDADPAAARAAFNAAPFTALERERWQRHPAFLLNPDSGR